MYKENSVNNPPKKWRTYVTGLLLRNFSSRKIDKYFRNTVSDSMAKAIEENWLRILGIDYDIITVNLSKENGPLGISLQGQNVFSHDGQEIIQRHYFRVILPTFCIGATNKFFVDDELLEVNGLKIYGMKSKDVVTTLKKLPNNIQIVVARPIRSHFDNVSDYGSSDEIHTSTSFYEMDEDLSSQTSTLKSNSSLFSSTSRDYGSSVSVGGLIEGRYDKVTEYLRTIIGWRGPIVIEFRKRNKESLGVALEEINDPKSGQLVIVVKVILPEMKAAKDGRMHVGDRLLQVNGKSVNGVGFRKVCQWMKSAPGGRLVLYICKPHFAACNTNNGDYLPDNYLYQTVSETDKLPRVQEENYVESVTISPIPEKFQNYLFIKRNGDKLGLFLDIADNGVNGCRIKKIARGLVRDDATLQEGDYVTLINGVSLKVDEKNKLENCLRAISQDSGDYNICFIKKEVIDIQKMKYSRNDLEQCPSFRVIPSVSNINDKPMAVISSPRTEIRNKGASDKSTFETFQISIKNDRMTNLGLVLDSSSSDPVRHSYITKIIVDSLAYKSRSFKVHDIIVSVNNQAIELMSPIDIDRHLNYLMQTEDTLHFQVKRIISSAKDSVDKSPELSDVPDLYFCCLSKLNNSFGFSVAGLMPEYGVTVHDVAPESAASKVSMMASGQRFVMINSCHVSTSSVNDIIKIVRSTQESIDLVMETPKFREFEVVITKDASNSFGLNIAGGIDTKSPFAIIESVVSNSTCHYSEPLQFNDIILEANEVSLISRSHDDIVKILRSSPLKSKFKIWRKLPFWKREFFRDIYSPSCISNHLNACQFSISISKPVQDIRSYGITFNDILILDPSGIEIRQRYKTVVSIERNSVCEKYASEMTRNCYLIAVNGYTIDVNMSCDALKEMIDEKDKVELLLSRDIPYNIHCRQNRYSPVLITKTDHNSYASSISTDSNLPIFDELSISTKNICLSNTEESIVTPLLNDRNSDDISNDIGNEVPSIIGPNRDFGVTITTVVVPKSDCLELGFRVYGGLNAGPNGETLPVYVVEVTRNSCNWPRDREQPWLSYGLQLLELNGANLTTMTSADINRLICSTDTDMRFKALRVNL